MTPKMGNDPLESLLVDAADVDRKAIAGSLRDRITIDAASGSLHLAQGFAALKSQQKVMALLLGQKAARLLKKADNSSLSVTQIVERSGLPSGTVAPGVRQLKTQHLISQDEDKSYFVADAQVSRAIEFLGPAIADEGQA